LLPLLDRVEYIVFRGLISKVARQRLGGKMDRCRYLGIVGGASAEKRLDARNDFEQRNPRRVDLADRGRNAIAHVPGVIAGKIERTHKNQHPQ
jgi:hypothetical protein